MFIQKKNSTRVCTQKDGKYLVAPSCVLCDARAVAEQTKSTSPFIIIISLLNHFIFAAEENKDKAYSGWERMDHLI